MPVPELRPPNGDERVEHRATGRATLLRTASQTFALNGVGLAANLASGVIGARALGAAGRGELAAVLVAPMIGVWIFAMSASRALSYHAARSPHEASALLSTWLLLSVPLICLGIGLTELLLPVLFAAQSEATLALGRVWAVTAALAIGHEVVNGMLLGDHDFLRYNLLRITPSIVIAAGYAALWTLGALTVVSALIVTAGAFSLTLVVGGYAVLTRHPPARPSTRIARATLSYGFRAQGTKLGEAVTTRLDLVMLPALVTASSVGLYSVAVNVSWIVVAAAGALSMLVLPLAATSESSAPSKVVSSFHATLVVGVALALAIAAVADIGLRIVYGPDFAEAANALRLLLPGCVLLVLGQILNAGMAGAGRPGTAALMQLPGIAITVVGLLAFVRDGGIEVAAAVSSVAYAVVTVCALVAYKRITNTPLAAFLIRRRDLRMLVRRLHLRAPRYSRRRRGSESP